MLDDQLRDAWHAQERAVAISPVMRFTHDGLVLGAGTVLVPRDGARWLKSLKGYEAELLALLSAAYSKAVAPAVLGNIERAAKCWSEGDVCLAYIHLAHARFPELQNPREAARCLFIVDRFIKAGTSPRTVFKALGLGSAYIAAIEKLYNPDQPRVPAGSGRASGEWTSDGAGTGGATTAGDGTGDAAQGSSVVGRMPLPASSLLGELDAGQVAELGAYASRLLGLGPIGAAAAAFGLLFIPSPNNLRVEGDVPEIPGLHYSWNRDETVLHLTYDPGGGAQRTFALQVDGDFIRDDDGQVVGRVIGGNRIAIDTPAVLPDLVKEDEPRLCPAAAPDVAGSDQGKPYEENRPRQYEDFVKLLINPPPDGPTPSGFVYYLPNPAESGKPISFDDCEKATGTVIEIKGEGLAKLTNDLPDIMADKFVDQATRQMAASGGRPIVWIFAEEGAALFARKLFDETPGLERITVAYVPWRSQR
jgi:hypothetical protein